MPLRFVSLGVLNVSRGAYFGSWSFHRFYIDSACYGVNRNCLKGRCKQNLGALGGDGRKVQHRFV